MQISGYIVQHLKFEEGSLNANTPRMLSKLPTHEYDGFSTDTPGCNNLTTEVIQEVLDGVISSDKFRVSCHKRG